jgi:hypothetical protein
MEQPHHQAAQAGGTQREQKAPADRCREDKPQGMAQPWLAAMAVDEVVLGPVVKLLTVASTSRGLSSAEVMPLNVVATSVQYRYSL